jgi:predicted TIM-barrel fold metal-dependent hydrolase
MERLAIDAAVVFPFVYSRYFALNGFSAGRLRRDPHGPSALPFQAENEALLREVYELRPELAGRLLPFAFFDPGRQPARQAGLIASLAARYPVFGLKTATSYLRSRVTALLGRGRALLDVAAELDVPVLLHTAVLPGDPWANVFEALRVVEARPDVRFMLAHACRLDRRALGRAHELPNCRVDLSAFTIHCRLAAQDHPAVAARADRFDADYARPAAAMHAMAEALSGTMVWGSDTPFYSWVGTFVDDSGRGVRLDLSCPFDAEARLLDSLPKGLRRAVSWGSTLEMLGGVRR